MPKIFEYFGFIFLFYSNEHEPIHVQLKQRRNYELKYRFCKICGAIKS